MNTKIKTYKVKGNGINPRVIKDEKFFKLCKSIEEFPEMLEIRPIVCYQEEDNYIILGGNMRFRACQHLGMKEIPVRIAEFNEEKRKEFIIKDNVSAGEWDWNALANEWDVDDLQNFGLDLVGFDLNHEDMDTEFSLDDSEKDPYQKTTFTLADEQVDQINNAISDIKKTDEYKYCETFGNTNANGNALYLIIMQWVEQRR